MKRNKIILTFSIVAVLALAFFVQTLVGADAVRVVASVIANDGTDVVRDGDSYQFSTRRGEYETVSANHRDERIPHTSQRAVRGLRTGAFA